MPLTANGSVKPFCSAMMGNWSVRGLYCGPDTEAGNHKCLIKFGAVRRGPTGGQLFDQLLDARSLSRRSALIAS